MTNPEVILMLEDEDGAWRRITIDCNRFTIGRSADNDLALDDASLSHRHAVLERFDDIIQISDCGSRNGTFVNDVPVSMTTLRDGDSISVGSCHFTVRINNGRVAAGKKENGRVAPSKPAENFLSTSAIAVMAAVTLIVVVIVIAALSGRKSSPTPRVTDQVDEIAEVESDRRELPRDESIVKTDSVSIEQIEKAASQVLRRVSSDDRPYVFPSNAAVEDIRRQAERYRNSQALAAALNNLAARGAEIAALAQREGIEPDLVIYTALALTDGGREDAAETARRILPELLSLRATFGTELADKSLILVAAYRMGGGTKKSHPLLATMRRVVKDPLNERTVWHLRERGGLSDDVYGFVVKFLALGMIAQNPRQFGVQAAPLAF